MMREGTILRLFDGRHDRERGYDTSRRVGTGFGRCHTILASGTVGDFGIRRHVDRLNGPRAQCLTEFASHGTPDLFGSSGAVVNTCGARHAIEVQGFH